MADQRISALTALTGANSATNDEFVIVDTSTGETKRMTRSELIEAVAQNLITLNASGVATLGGLTVDTDTLHVDTPNGRVGIGTVNPAVQFDISSATPKIRLTDTDGGYNEIANNSGVLNLFADQGNTQGSSAIIMKVDTVEAVRINANGTFLVGTTAFGAAGAGDIVVNGGIFLGGSAAANELNDYEALDYTATLTPETSGTINLNSPVDLLAYTKVGRKVTVQGMVNIDTVSSPVGTKVNLSLPFTIANISEFSGRFGGSITFWDSSTTTFSVLPFRGAEGASIIEIIVDASTLGASDEFYFDFTYIAA